MKLVIAFVFAQCAFNAYAAEVFMQNVGSMARRVHQTSVRDLHGRGQREVFSGS